MSITQSMEVSEEIIQEIFYVLWRDRAKIHILYSIKSYLYKAVYNESLQHLKKASVRERYAQTAQTEEAISQTPESDLELKELQEIIEQVLNRTTERRKRIFLLHRSEGMTYAEIAKELSLSVKTVEAEMSKVLVLLRKNIERYSVNNE